MNFAYFHLAKRKLARYNRPNRMKACGRRRRKESIMVEKDTGILERYTEPLSRRIQEEYAIGPQFYQGEVKKGLRNSDGTGVLVGVTKVGSVQGYLLQDGQRIPTPGRLYYRGIELTDIVEAHRRAGTFGYEEVAYLLVMGYLPTEAELKRFKDIMSQARKLPEGFTEGMIMRHPSGNMMNELARSVLSLYSYDASADDTSIENLLLQSVKLIGCFPSIVANSYAVKRHYFQGDSLHIHFPVAELSTAENFLRMIRPDTNYTEEEAHLLDMMLMVHAEHGGGNNSTFVCRALTSAGTDAYSAYSGAIGALKGFRHGGANIKVMEMMEDIRLHVPDCSDKEALEDYLAKIINKEAFDRKGLVYGMGHAVYSLSDPRERIFKGYVEKLAAEKGRGDDLTLYRNVEELAPQLIAKHRRIYKGVSPNVDFYSGFVYDMLGIPQELYTAMFAVARIVGWSAHRIEELICMDKIIRPAYMSVMEERE